MERVEMVGREVRVGKKDRVGSRGWVKMLRREWSNVELGFTAIGVVQIENILRSGQRVDGIGRVGRMLLAVILLPRRQRLRQFANSLQQRDDSEMVIGEGRLLRKSNDDGKIS